MPHDNEAPEVIREQRAREVLAQCWRDEGRADLAHTIASGRDTEWSKSAVAIRAMLAFASPAEPALGAGGLRDMPADDEIRLLREALTIYGDRVRMATSCRPDLQQVIDYAFEHTQDRPAFGGDSETRPPSLPAGREAIRMAVFRHTGCSERCADDAADAIVELCSIGPSVAGSGECCVSDDLAARLDPAPDIKPIGQPKLHPRRMRTSPPSEKGETK